MVTVDTRLLTACSGDVSLETKKMKVGCVDRMRGSQFSALQQLMSGFQLRPPTMQEVTEMYTGRR